MENNPSRIMNVFRAIIIPLLLIVSPVSVHSQERVYTFGVVPQFKPIKLRAIWQPVIDYLETETGYQFFIKASRSIPDFETGFTRGEFDFAYMNPYHMLLANKKEGYVPLVRDVKRTLHGVLVVRRDGGIKKVADLAGKTVAFPAPNALGASLLIRQELYDDFRISITHRYVKTHDSVYLNVLTGEATAGGGVQKTLHRQEIKDRAALTIIHKTKDVASHPIAVHPKVSKEVVKAVKTALLKLGETIEGKRLLARIPISTIGHAEMSDYAPLKKLKLERFYIK